MEIKPKSSGADPADPRDCAQSTQNDPAGGAQAKSRAPVPATLDWATRTPGFAPDFALRNPTAAGGPNSKEAIVSPLLARLRPSRQAASMDSKQRDLPKEEPGTSSVDERSQSRSPVALTDSDEEEVAVLVRRSPRPKLHNPFVAKAKESLHKAFRKVPRAKLITPDSRRESSTSGTSASVATTVEERLANSEPKAAPKAPLPAQTEEPLLLVERSQESLASSSSPPDSSTSAKTATFNDQQVLQRRPGAVAASSKPQGSQRHGAFAKNSGAGGFSSSQPRAPSGEAQVFERRSSPAKRSGAPKLSGRSPRPLSGEQQVFKRRPGTAQGNRKRKQYRRSAPQESELGLSWWYSIWSRSAWIGRALWIAAFGCAWVALSRCMDPGVSDPELSQVPYYALLGWLFCAGLALNRNIPSRFRWTALALGLANSAALAMAWNFRLDQL